MDSSITGGGIPPVSHGRSDVQKRMIVVYVVMTVMSTVVLALRLYTRIFIRRLTGLDDVMVTLSWLGCIAWLVLCFQAFQYGLGQHIWNLSMEQIMAWTRMLVGIMVVYVWTPALSKLSLLALYYRLNPDYKIRGCIYALMALISGYSLAITIVAAGPCNPQHHKDQKCLTDLNLFMACINIITDFLILCLPIPMLHALQLPMKQKALLAMVFGVGSGVIVISIVRIIYVYSMISDPDQTYNVGKACIFSTVELNGGVICVCAALLKPFIQKHLPCILSFSNRSGNGSGSGIQKLRMFKLRGAGQRLALENIDAERDAGRAASREANNKSNHQIAVTRSYSVRGARKGKENSDSMDELFGPNLGWNESR